MKYLLVFLVGCTSVQWGKPVFFDPHLHSHDFQSISITDREGSVIKCNEESFNQYVSMSKSKLKELAKIISVARVPTEFKPQKEKLITELNRASE